MAKKVILFCLSSRSNLYVLMSVYVCRQFHCNQRSGSLPFKCQVIDLKNGSFLQLVKNWLIPNTLLATKIVKRIRFSIA